MIFGCLIARRGARYENVLRGICKAKDGADFASAKSRLTGNALDASLETRGFTAC
jgi:hypothetical protein